MSLGKETDSFAPLLLIVLLHLVRAGDPCPNKAELSPCTCSQVEVKPLLFKELALATSPLPTPTRLRRAIDAIHGLKDLEVQSRPDVKENSTYYTAIQCKAPKTLSILEESVSVALHRKLVDKLLVTNVPPKKEHTLARLPSSWLKYVRVKQFEIRDSIMSGDFIHFGSSFLGQEQSMISFTAVNCYLYGSLTYEVAGTVNTKGLNLLPYLQVINLSKNHLTYLSNTAFRYPPANLTTINLSHNSIQAIEGSVFNYAPKLEAVNLSHNLIENLARNFFAAPARYLKDIDLSWNNIKVIPVDMFTNMPSLKVVNLSQNFLYSLPAKPWSTVWRQLNFIDLRGNFVECSCDLLWLLDILSPKKENITTTPAPTTLPGQTVLGSCEYTEPQMYAQKYQLIRLTRGNLNCPI